jgi:hypothetical protein
VFLSSQFFWSTGRLSLAAGLLTACGEVTSLQIRSPGGDNALLADLTPGPIEAPDRMPLDALLQMRVGVGNSGSLPAGPGWVVRVFLSTDPLIEASDHQIDQFVTSRDLPVGGQDLYLRNKKLSGIVPGEYYIGSVLDPTQIVPEMNETNNTLASPGRITLVPEAPAP